MAVVVAEHPAKAITAGDVTFRPADSFARHNEIVAQALMVTFAVTMIFELSKSTT